MDKAKIVSAILEALREEFESRQVASKRTRAGGNDAESKSEGKYDTRSIEENYLADGLAKQAQAAVLAATAYENLALQASAADEPIDLGALIEIEFSSETAWFFLGPAAGGIEVEHAGQTVTVITPESPLGSQLLDHKAGDAIASPKARILTVR
jgi:transcription elongation GreA/GreB family factor